MLHGFAEQLWQGITPGALLDAAEARRNQQDPRGPLLAGLWDAPRTLAQARKDVDELRRNALAMYLPNAPYRLAILRFYDEVFADISASCAIACETREAISHPYASEVTSADLVVSIGARKWTTQLVDKLQTVSEIIDKAAAKAERLRVVLIGPPGQPGPININAQLAEGISFQCVHLNMAYNAVARDCNGTGDNSWF